MIGFGRDLDALTGAPVGPRDFVWETAPDGAAVANLVLASPGAAGIRAQLLAKSLPEDLIAGFYDPTDAEGTVEWISAGELTATPSPADDGYVYWSPTVGGDRIGIELRIPSGAWSGASVIIPRISHLDRTLDNPERSADESCDQTDAVCRSDRISDTARNSVAKYLYTTESGETSSCTGNLLNDQDLATQIPYLLTANHCPETAAEVASTEFYWFHETPVCGDDSAYSTLRQGRGATRLAHDGFYGSDMVLMRLHEKPPFGVGLVGWTTEPVALGDDMVGLHHPNGDVKKILIGRVERYNFPGSRTYKAMARASEGASIGGSSGAGIWRRDDSGRDYLVGTISESTAGTCPPREKFTFARLNVFQPRIAQWVGVGSALEEVYLGDHAGFLLREPLGPVIAALRDGDVVDLSAVGTGPFSIQAGFSLASEPPSVSFELTGPHSLSRISNTAPHRLTAAGGGIGLAPGEYALTAIAHAGPDGAGDVLETQSVAFTVTGASDDTDRRVASLWLADSGNGTVFGEITDGGTVEVDRSLDAALEIRAATAGTGLVASVGYALSGTAPSVGVGNGAPFAWPVAPPAGTYSVTATPYAEPDAAGAAGTALTRTAFTLAYPPARVPVRRLLLVDASDGSELMELVPDAVVDLNATDASSFNIHAELAADVAVGSVRMELAGALSASRVSNAEPHALYGAGRGVSLLEGDYTVTARPFDRANVTGTALPARTVPFRVERGAGEPPSTDASLSGLALAGIDSGTETDIVLDPTFNASTTAYTASVPHGVDQVTIEGTKSDSGARVDYFDATDTALTDADGNAAGFQVALGVGANTIKAKVTASDGETTQTYTVLVTRAAGDVTAPTADGATVDGTTLTITFNEALAAAANLANGAFTVKRTPSGGSETSAALAGAPAVSGATVTLTLAAAVAATDTVTVSYAKPATGTDNSLKDANGNEVADFADLSVTNETQAEAPEAPSAPTLTVGITWLEASWTAPADNGSAITGYDLHYRESGGNWEDTNHVGTSTTKRINGLDAETAYEVRVRASNAEGAGGWSPTAAGRTGGTDGAVEGDDTPPNIVLFLSDDMGWGQPGFNGGEEVETPSIDRIAEEGVRLTQFYVAPVCTATRGALLTGRYSWKNGTALRFNGRTGMGMRVDERTLAEALRDAGYATWLVGKWHLGQWQHKHLPLQRGFDHHYGLYGAEIDSFSHHRGRTRDLALDWHRNGRPVVETGYSTLLLADEAVQLIERHDPSDPFFLYLPFNAVHNPNDAPQEYIDRYSDLENPKQRAQLAVMDVAIGRVLDALQAKGVLDDTLVMFLNDNGGTSTAGWNAPYRGKKSEYHEGGIRVPAVLRWPGKIATGSENAALLHAVDLFPTFAGLAGADTDAGLPLDGVDAWAAIAAGAASPRDEVVHSLDVIRKGDWKLIEEGIDYYGWTTDAPELYDIATDPYERTNLASTETAKVVELRARLAHHAQFARDAEASDDIPDYPPAVYGEEENAAFADKVETAVDQLRAGNPAPSPVRLEVSGASVKLVHDEALDAGSVPPTSAFTVVLKPGYRAAEVTSVAVNGRDVTLTLAETPAGEVLGLTYEVPDTGAIRDMDELEAAGRVWIAATLPSTDASLAAMIPDRRRWKRPVVQRDVRAADDVVHGGSRERRDAD